MKRITRVGVLGGGLMGSGIAQVSALAGFKTVMREVSEPLCDKAMASIRKSLEKGIEKGKVTPEARDAALGNLACVTDVAKLGESEIVIEAVSEDLELKNTLWKELNSVCPPGDDLCIEHIESDDRRHGCGLRPTGQNARPSLLQSRSADEARGGHSHHHHE
jgi:3-hydroxybutyryl-CoA dehydrogenase